MFNYPLDLSFEIGNHGLQDPEIHTNTHLHTHTHTFET